MPAPSQHLAMNDIDLPGPSSATAVREQLAEPEHDLYREPTRLSDLFSTLPPGSDPAVAAAEVRDACAQAILGVLRRADRPLTTLDLLDELGHRYHCWTSSTVRHTLADLVDRGVLMERRDLRPHGYALAAGQPG
jgi:Penicillinase repressor